MLLSFFFPSTFVRGRFLGLCSPCVTYADIFSLHDLEEVFFVTNLSSEQAGEKFPVCDFFLRVCSLHSFRNSLLQLFIVHFLVALKVMPSINFH